MVGSEGLVIALRGPLGAGKTLFVKGLAEGLGVAPERVSSPTFVIASEYPLADGRVLVHVDLYRVATLGELESAGLRDWLAPANVVAVEWADRLPEALPADRLEVALAVGGERGSQRRLNAIASGPGARARLARWHAAVAAAAGSGGLALAPDRRSSDAPLGEPS